MTQNHTMPETVNVLLIGTGGREHALGRRLADSPRLGTLWVQQGANAGLASLGRTCPEAIPDTLNANDRFRLRKFRDEASIHLVVVGPEVPLANGIADLLAGEHTLVFGPGADGARLEADKGYAKDLMRSAAIPTAEGRTFTDLEAARTYIQQRGDRCVVKAAGLAAGKGVVVCDSAEEGVAAVDLIMADRTFGTAGDCVVVEERLEGQEMSVLALVDGRTISVLDPCQDHKQVGEGDIGPNTGGMGAYCPTPLANAELMQRVHSDILVPTVDALRRDGINFRGVLYAGLMLTPSGPKVLEFNVRFGDPECQPLMTRLQGDLIELLWNTAAGTLDTVEFDFDPRTACTVVLCAEGYPGSYAKGHEITGIEAAEALEGVTVFHSGTTRSDTGAIVTNGGRVLGVTALADDLRTARDLANQACDLISFEGAFHRRDIGSRVLAPVH
ncbi:MAG: phosphoribosylamine--glycine ligase [Planctomycetota bacterium]|nr:phosphoribosylamine--glycine ligase [Planctomycetota bacterium]MEE2681417.1 phosphoribosylamine--glycine ligase [Planctomycetota bacterium]